jgi:hypothetical protein
MPLPKGATISEARVLLGNFLSDTGCYNICAQCPIYPGGEGCCHGCAKLSRDENGTPTGCGEPNLSCLSYTCGVLNEHLRRQDKLDEFIELTYGLRREGYRGCEKRPDDELIQITDPLSTIIDKEAVTIKSIFSGSAGAFLGGRYLAKEARAAVKSLLQGQQMARIRKIGRTRR